MDPRLIERIHAEVDGANSEAESADLRRRLETDPEGSRLLEELHQLSNTLADDEAVDAPADLRREILREITRERESHFAAPAHTHTKSEGIRLPRWLTEPLAAWKEDGMSRKTLIWAASVAVVAVAVGYVGIRYSDGTESAEGTIRPAERYEADQIGQEDVALGDTAVQDFMQSEVFDEWINDPNSLLHDEKFMQQLQDPMFAKVFSLADGALVDLVDKSHVIRDPAFMLQLSELSSLKDSAVIMSWASKGYFNDPAFILGLQNLSKFSDPAYAQSFSKKSPFRDPAFIQRLQEMSSLKDPAFVQQLSKMPSLKDAAFLQRISEVPSLKDAAFLQRISEVPSLKDPAFLQRLSEVSALKDPALLQKIGQQSASLKDPAFLSVVQDAAAIKRLDDSLMRLRK